MKKIYSIIVLALLAASVNVNAQSFPWSSHSKGSKSSVYSQGALSRNFNLTGNGTESDYPQYNNGGGGNLATSVNWSNRTSSVTMTITFSKPLVGVTFLLFDVDQTTGSWDDKLTITALNETGATIYPALTGNSYTTISGTNRNVIEGKSNNTNYTNSPAVASFTSQYVKSLSIVFSAGSSSPSNPASQVVGVGGIVYENVLPIDLMWFKADKKNNTTDLKWQTENQEGFSHFEIERSANGADDFTSIAKIQTSAATTGNYSYTDVNAARLSQKAYYRLKMVDQDGQYKYSAVVVVTFENAASIMVTPNLLNAGEMISVNIAGNNQSKYDVKLFDMSGKMISQQAGNSRMQIATSGLRKGMYIVSVSNLNEAKTFRIMVQ
ncbi:MAG TPA: T9SS type A sorting domain-containing protein [Chitinophagaceae bacterium]|nr:T9SS type A sorting domain-containing protein [Chitinophagaceae bacterium]HPN59324.1 T9SS type A sorting domain-containing protein [Chitinophagaceae bacterium]